MDIYSSTSTKSLKLKRVRTWFRNIFLICTALVVPAIVFDKNIKQVFFGEAYQLYGIVMGIIFIVGLFSFLGWIILLIVRLLSNRSRRRTVGIIFLALWAVCTAAVVLAIIFDRNIRAALTPSAYIKIGNIFGAFFISGLFSFFTWILLLGNKLVRIITLTFIVLVVVFLASMRPHKINGRLMEPAFLDRSYMLSNKLVYLSRPPERGDIIIYSTPDRGKQTDVIGRIVGLPDENLVITNGLVTINGKVLDEPYANWTGADINEPIIYKLGPDEYWAPFDVRSYMEKPFKRKDIIGKVFYVYWPLERKGPIK